MVICFLFKPDMIICGHPISVFHIKNEPFHDIPYIEWQKQQLFLLCHMNQLMIEFSRA